MSTATSKDTSDMDASDKQQSTNDAAVSNRSLDATPAMIATPAFRAVYRLIRAWDVQRPGDLGYMGANGSHVRAILDARKSA